MIIIHDVRQSWPGGLSGTHRGRVKLEQVFCQKAAYDYRCFYVYFNHSSRIVVILIV